MDRNASLQKAREEIRKVRDAVNQFESNTVSKGLDHEVEMTCNYLFEDMITSIQKWEKELQR